MAACCTYHRSTYFPYGLAAKHQPYKKAYLFTKNIEEYSGKKSQENRPVGKKKKRQKE